MKRLISLLLALFICTSAFTVYLSGAPLKDVSEGKWYTDGVNFCVANDYMSGVSDTLFDLNSDLTRAMFMTILAKVDGVDLAEYEGKSSFGDVKTDGWYTAAIEWAAENEITGGIGDGADGRPIFGYKNPITREQIALFFYVYSEYVNEKNALPETDPINDEDIVEPRSIDLSLRADLSVFDDGERTHAWAREAMEWAVAVGLISGTGEKALTPRGNCSRAQTAVMIRAYVLKFFTECEHETVEANCEDKGYCSLCGIYFTPALGHEYKEYRCDKQSLCLRCNKFSKYKEHNLTEYNCIQGSHCTECGYVKEKPRNNHILKYGYCLLCDYMTDPDDEYIHFFKEFLNKASLNNYYYKHDWIEALDIEFRFHISDSYKCPLAIYRKVFDMENNLSFDLRVELSSKADNLYKYTLYCSLGGLTGTFRAENVKNSFTYDSIYYNTPEIHEFIIGEIYDALAYSEHYLNTEMDMSLRMIGFDPSEFVSSGPDGDKG